MGGPSGCLQFFTNDMGTFSSFNYVTPATPEADDTGKAFNMYTMGCTETKKFRFSLFFNFSFFGEKWRTKNEKSIFFIFSQISFNLRGFSADFLQLFAFFEKKLYLR